MRSGQSRSQQLAIELFVAGLVGLDELAGRGSLRIYMSAAFWKTSTRPGKEVKLADNSCPVPEAVGQDAAVLMLFGGGSTLLR